MKRPPRRIDGGAGDGRGDAPLESHVSRVTSVAGKKRGGGGTRAAQEAYIYMRSAEKLDRRRKRSPARALLTAFWRSRPHFWRFHSRARRPRGRHSESVAEVQPVVRDVARTLHEGEPPVS